MTSLVNLTSHDITFVKKVDGEEMKVVLKPSNMWARINELSSEKIGHITLKGLEIPIFEKGEFYTNIKWKNRMFGLPSPKKDTYYIVSRIVAYHNLERKDLLIPDTNSNKDTQFLYRMKGV